MEGKEQLKIYTKTLSSKHTVFLNEVSDPVYFNDFFDLLQNCSEQDFVEININSFGGLECSAIQFYNELKNCKAHVHCSTSGYCCSAGSVILLAGNTWSITKNSKIMIHSPSGWFSGKHNDVITRIDFEREWVNSFFKEVYKGFLTEKEIKEAIEGKDFWFTGEEAITRLEKMVKEKKQ